ncbi:hypothetical protein KKB64_00790 [Patescibacteria group bacterium]|nr:hypothetical protein [Patescibacteria group bacterium]MBU1472310.1 hypothetical protein [Patescibacteria group bacterium]MBU2460439.1 hypothetical protein [Patescibacteria group bacterium]MBU2544258.1 hypothetical protein [Patescibacteria group bacterium]
MSSEDKTSKSIVESLPFNGSIREIRVIPGDKQVVIIYFGNIKGRPNPDIYEWGHQPKGKIDGYEQRLLALIN